MRRRILELLFVLAMIMVLVPGSVFAAETASGTCGENLTWALEDGVLTISGTGAMTEYSSDSEAPWYEYHEMITELLVDEEVTSLSRYGFRYFEKLEAIYYNATAMDDLSRDSDIFYRTGGDSPDVTVVIGANVTRIPSYLFYNSGGSPEWDASWNCNGVTAVIFEEGSKCETIGNDAFSYCYSLNRITIPESVTSIGNYAFYNCKNLLIQIEASELPETLGLYWNYGAAICMNVVKFGVTEYGQDYWITDDNTAHVWKYHGDDTTVTIPETIEGAPVVEIATSAFATIIRPFLDPNGKITYVEIPDSVTTINSFAFDSCIGLEKIVIPESVECIGKSAFSNCTNVSEIYFDAIAMSDLEYDNSVFKNVGNNTSGVKALIGSKVTRIPDYLFSPQYKSASSYYETLNLMTVEFEKGSVCESIGRHAFHHCTTLSEITLPESITIIGEDAFYNCTGLTQIQIPENVKTMGENAFYNCTGLSSIYYNATAMENLSGYTAYPDVFAYAGTGGDGIVVIIGDNVTYIPGNLFKSPAFRCAKITEVVFEDGSQCTGIGSSAFYGCDYLTNISIPENVRNFGSSVFAECSGLISAGPVGSGYNIEFSWNDSIPDHTFSHSNLTEITLPDSISSIGSYAFAYCKGASGIDLPTNLIAIGEMSFIGCSGLLEISIPEKVETIDDKAFKDCSALTEIVFNAVSMNDLDEFSDIFAYAGNVSDGINVTVGSNVTRIPAHLFAAESFTVSGYTPNIISVVFEDNSSCKVIGKNAFAYLSSVSEIEIPGSVTSIGTYAFHNCTTLTNTTIPESVTSIDKNVFYNCTKLNSAGPIGGGYNVEFGWAESIPANAFYGCTSLTEVVLPASISEIGSYAFGYTGALEDIYYGGSEAQWESIEFGEGNASLTDATIHYNCDISSSDKNNTVIDGSVCFFREWDAEKQVAYFDNAFMGAEVSDETDPTFLENVEKLVGNYVLVEYVEQKNDGMVVSPIIRNAVLVDAREGFVTTADSDYIVIDGKGYVTPENITLPGLYANSKVRYFLYKNELVGIELIASESPEKSDSGYYGVFEEAAEDEIILHEYKYDWEKAYNDFASAVTVALEKFSGTDSETQTATIVEEAKRMQKSDDASNSRYLSGDLGSYKSWAYRALAEFFYENTCSTFDLASIDLSKDFAGAQMVNNVLKSCYGKTESYRYGNIQVDLIINTVYSVRFGSLTVYNVNRKESSKKTALVCSTKEECEVAINDYLDELQSLATNSAYNVANAVSKDILGKPLSSLSENYLKEAADKIERRLAVTLTEKFKLAGVGDLISNINQCYSYYKCANKVIELVKNTDIEGLTKELSNFEIKDTTIKDAGVKKTSKALNKMAKRFLKAYEDYIAGTLAKKENSFWNLVFKCPVNVTVYNSKGEQIGYVGEEDLWYTDEIEIIDLGGAKQILVLTEDLPTFEVTSFDYGTMDCTIEQNDENYNPIGRLNYYDIILSPDQQFYVSLVDEVIDDTETLKIKTGDKEILADEYISSSDKAGVEIICTPETDDGSVGGTVSGGGTYIRGDAVVLRASEEDGYSFAGWFENDLLLSIDKIYEFSARNDMSISAKFVLDDFKYVSTATTQGGYTVGDGRYESGESATAIAVPFPNYQFEGWYENGVLVSKEREYKFLVANDVYLEARFTFANPFTDLVKNSSYYNAVLWAVEKGITTGTDKTHFSPKADCTRAQIVTFLWRYAGEPEPTTTKHKFVDIVEGSSYYKAVLWAVEKGITNGLDETHFGPKEPCTRAQIVTFLWRAAGKPQPSSQQHNFTDIVRGSSYYDAVLWAVEKGITTGADSTHFNPKDTCTRAQGMTFLWRYNNTK